MSESFDEAKNRIERATEAKYPGYKGPRWGEFTPGKEMLVIPRRTQISFADGTSYWLDVPAGSILPGDMIAIAEREGLQKVQHAGMTLNGEYFDTKDAVPHKFGTFVELHRGQHNG